MDSDKQLPWLWVIESLSTSKLVDSSFLNVLISKASQLTGDESFREIAKEKLAVDQLEDLIGGVSTCSEENAINRKSQPKFRLDKSERAQDVLTRLLDIIGKSRTKVSLLESLKWDVRKFCIKDQFYRKLKSSIASSCSREMSEMPGENRPHKEKIVDPEVRGGRNCSAKLFSQRGGSSETEELQDHRTNCSGGDTNVAAVNRDADVRHIEIQPPDSCHLLSENGNTLLPEDSRGKGLTCTRERSPELNKSRGLGGCKLGLDIAGNADDQSLEQGLKDGGVRLECQTSAPIVPEHPSEVLQDNPPDSTLVSDEKESRFPKLVQEDYLGKGNSCGDIGQLKSLRQNSIPLHANGSVRDPSERVLVSGEKEVSEFAERTLVHDMLGGVNLVDDGHGCESTPFKKLKKSRENSEIKHIEEVIAEEALDACQLKSSINVSKGVSASTYTALSSRNGEKRACSSDSGMVTAAKKQKCLNFNSPFSRGSQLEGGLTEGKLCRKCNRSDGNLLICSVLSCHVAVHESCAGSSVNVTDSAKYHCPICSCVEAIAVYCETKKQVSLVKKKREVKNQATEELCISEHGNGLHHRGIEVRSQNCGNTLNLEERGKAQMIKDKSLEGGDQENIEPCTSCDDLSQRGIKKTTQHCKNTSNMEEADKTKLVENQSGVLEEKKKSNATAKSASSTYTKPAAVCQLHTDVEKEIEDWQYTGSTSLRRSSRQLVNVNKVAENGLISLDTNRHPRISTQLTVSGRRDKIAWSAEEVEILKEGVWKYSTNNGQTAPWTKVLQFGSHVFQRSRTAGDVKDKWRNIWSRGGGRRE